MADWLSLRRFSREGKVYERGVPISDASNERALPLAIGYIMSCLTYYSSSMAGYIFCTKDKDRGDGNKKILLQ
jgi:hypothetical protein